MSQLLELQVDVMYLMWARAQGKNRCYTEEEVYIQEAKSANTKIGPVSRHRINLVIAALLKRSHIVEHDLNDQAEVVYMISSLGVRWVEDWFRITQSDGSYWFHRRYSDVLRVDLLRAQWDQEQANEGKRESVKLTEYGSDFWTKVGAIMTIIGILVAIFIAALD